MEEKLTNLTIFWNLKEKSVLYQSKTDALSNVLVLSSKFKKKFTEEFMEFIQSNKRRTNVMTRCRIPEFCVRHKTDIGIYDGKSKKIIPRTVKEKKLCSFIHKNQYCFTG